APRARRDRPGGYAGSCAGSGFGQRAAGRCQQCSSAGHPLLRRAAGCQRDSRRSRRRLRAWWGRQGQGGPILPGMPAHGQRGQAGPARLAARPVSLRCRGRRGRAGPCAVLAPMHLQSVHQSRGWGAMKAKAKKVLKWLSIGLAVFALASVLSLYFYGRFAESARGGVVMALPLAGDQTPIDRAVAPLTDARPGQTGMVILGDNLDAFAVRAMTARSAGRSLDLQYYIWHDDFTGNMLHHEALLAADRGVRVRLLLDDMNVHGSHSVLASLDSHPLIEVRLFNPTRSREGTLARGAELLLRFFSLNRRMHNKIWLADGRVAVVGGRNIGDEYFDAAADVNFTDTDVAVVGTAARQAGAEFDSYWNSRSPIPPAAPG